MNQRAPGKPALRAVIRLSMVAGCFYAMFGCNAPAGCRRLTGLRSAPASSGAGLNDLARKSSAFKTTEGAKGFRGPVFQDLTMSFARFGGGLPQAQVFEYLGYSDFAASDGDVRLLIYRYNRFGEKDWEFNVRLDNGNVTVSGWNTWSASGVESNPAFQKFTPGSSGKSNESPNPTSR